MSRTRQLSKTTRQSQTAPPPHSAGAPRSAIAARRNRPPRPSEQALHDLGLPEDLVAEIEGRLRSQQQAVGQNLSG